VASLVAAGRRGEQEEAYAASAQPLVEYVVQGKGNATCFCYGATGTGKTYTMLGSNDQPGIMVLSLRDLFQHVEAHPEVKVGFSSHACVTGAYLYSDGRQVHEAAADGVPSSCPQRQLHANSGSDAVSPHPAPGTVSQPTVANV
jgi:hypothetical protein